MLASGRQRHPIFVRLSAWSRSANLLTSRQAAHTRLPPARAFASAIIPRTSSFDSGFFGPISPMLLVVQKIIHVLNPFTPCKAGCEPLRLAEDRGAGNITQVKENRRDLGYTRHVQLRASVHSAPGSLSFLGSTAPGLQLLRTGQVSPIRLAPLPVLLPAGPFFFFRNVIDRCASVHRRP